MLNEESQNLPQNLFENPPLSTPSSDSHVVKDAKETAQEMGHVIIYTDGAAEPNPGPGGYGVVMIAGKHRKELSGGFRRTTNNRMELMGVIIGLEALTKPCRVTLYSDSKYVVDSVERGSVQRWKKNNWYRTKTDKAKNADLWARFLDIYEKHRVQFKWVKGHAGVPENERCDELAVAAAQSGDLSPDVGYLAEIYKNNTNLNRIDGLDTPESCELSLDAFTEVDQRTAMEPPHEPTEGEIVIHKEAGEPCRKCGVALVQKATKAKKPKPGQTYFYAWYLSCPGCNRIYLVEKAKRLL